MIGKVAECNRKIVGIIVNEERVKEPIYSSNKIKWKYSYMYYGITFNGEPWQTKNPKVIANSPKEYIQNNIEKFTKELSPSEVTL